MKGGVFMWEWDIFEVLYIIIMFLSDRIILMIGIYKEEKRIWLKNEQQLEQKIFFFGGEWLLLINIIYD